MTALPAPDDTTDEPQADPLADLVLVRRPPPDPAWARLGACVDKPPAWWYPTEAERHLQAPARMAIAICDHCPVQFDCLAHALDVNEPYGIWGGRTEEARDRLRRQLRTDRPSSREDRRP